MQHPKQDLGRSHGHEGLHQAEGLHQERPTVKNKSAVDWEENSVNIHTRLMLVFKTPKNSSTVRKQITGLKMGRRSAQESTSKDRHRANGHAKTGSVHVQPKTQQEVCHGRKGLFWLMS